MKALKGSAKVQKSVIAILITFALIFFFTADPVNRGAMAGTIVYVALKVAAFLVIGYGLYLGYKRLRGE